MVVLCGGYVCSALRRCVNVARLLVGGEFSTKTSSRARQLIKRSPRCQINQTAHLTLYYYRFDFFRNFGHGSLIKRKRTGGIGQGQHWSLTNFFSHPFVMTNLFAWHDRSLKAKFNLGVAP
jgi:hypothetical protein